MSASTSPRSEWLLRPIEGAAARFLEEAAPPQLTALARAGRGLSLWSPGDPRLAWPLREFISMKPFQRSGEREFLAEKGGPGHRAGN